MDVSIIIPTLNRASGLEQALRSVAVTSKASQNVEIIVIDNGSVDNTGRIVQAVAEQFPRLELRYFCDRMPGLLTGRHRGAQEARGEILAYLDDDVLLASTWLDGLRDAFCDPSIVLVGGPSRPQYEVDPLPWLAALWHESDGHRSLGWLSLIDEGQEKKRTDPCVIWGLNYAIRKDALLACGGFHPDIVPKALQRYQGDGETGLSLKIKDRGLGALYHPDVAVTHLIPASRLTVEAFEQRAFYQGVCDSYTATRREGAVLLSGSRSWRDVLRLIKRRLQGTISSTRDEVAVVCQRLHEAYASGFAFHQNEVRNNPALLEWVLRPHYWDYRLPEIAK